MDGKGGGGRRGFVLEVGGVVEAATVARGGPAHAAMSEGLELSGIRAEVIAAAGAGRPARWTGTADRTTLEEFAHDVEALQGVAAWRLRWEGTGEAPGLVAHGGAARDKGTARMAEVVAGVPRPGREEILDMLILHGTTRAADAWGEEFTTPLPALVLARRDGDGIVLTGDPLAGGRKGGPRSWWLALGMAAGGTAEAWCPQEVALAQGAPSPGEDAPAYAARVTGGRTRVVVRADGDDLLAMATGWPVAVDADGDGPGEGEPGGPRGSGRIDAGEHGPLVVDDVLGRLGIGGDDGDDGRGEEPSDATDGDDVGVDVHGHHGEDERVPGEEPEVEPEAGSEPEPEPESESDEHRDAGDAGHPASGATTPAEGEDGIVAPTRETGDGEGRASGRTGDAPGTTAADDEPGTGPAPGTGDGDGIDPVGSVSPGAGGTTGGADEGAGDEGEKVGDKRRSTDVDVEVAAYVRTLAEAAGVDDRRVTRTMEALLHAICAAPGASRLVPPRLARPGDEMATMLSKVAAVMTSKPEATCARLVAVLGDVAGQTRGERTAKGMIEAMGVLEGDLPPLMRQVAGLAMGEPVGGSPGSGSLPDNRFRRPAPGAAS